MANKSTKQARILRKLLPKNRSINIAEIGVFEARTTEYLLTTLPNISKYYCVDCWEMYPDFQKILKPGGSYDGIDMDELFRKVVVKLSKFGDRVSIIREYSEEGSKYIQDGELDCVFIDANHEYKYVKKDIFLWLPKVKKGGLVSGHDYGESRFGVTEAVNEIFPKASIKGSVWYIKK